MKPFPFRQAVERENRLEKCSCSRSKGPDSVTDERAKERLMHRWKDKTGFASKSLAGL